MNEVHGSCLCGALQFSLHLPVKWVAHCHCTLCQRAHGAAFVSWVGAADGQYMLQGESLRWYESSPGAERGFCTSCGSTALFRSTRWPGELHFARALIAGDDLPLPQAHVYCASSPRWLREESPLPRFDELPPNS